MQSWTPSTFLAFNSFANETRGILKQRSISSFNSIITISTHSCDYYLTWIYYYYFWTEKLFVKPQASKSESFFCQKKLKQTFFHNENCLRNVNRRHFSSYKWSQCLHLTKPSSGLTVSCSSQFIFSAVNVCRFRIWSLILSHLREKKIVNFQLRVRVIAEIQITLSLRKFTTYLVRWFRLIFNISR